MTLSELKEALKRYAGVDDEDPLTIWVNAGLHMMEAAEDWPFLMTRTTIALPAGSSTLNLPSNFFKPYTIKSVTNPGSPLEYWDPRKWDREIEDETMTGHPQVYTILGSNVVQVCPVPDTDLTVKLLYQRVVNDLVNPDDVPSDIPTRFHYGIVVASAVIALQAESEEGRAEAALAEFNEWVGRAMMAYSTPELGEPDQVQDTQGYGGY